MSLDTHLNQKQQQPTNRVNDCSRVLCVLLLSTCGIAVGFAAFTVVTGTTAQMQWVALASAHHLPQPAVWTVPLLQLHKHNRFGQRLRVLALRPARCALFERRRNAERNHSRALHRTCHCPQRVARRIAHAETAREPVGLQRLAQPGQIRQPGNTQSKSKDSVVCVCVCVCVFHSISSRDHTCLRSPRSARSPRCCHLIGKALRSCHSAHTRTSHA